METSRLTHNGETGYGRNRKKQHATTASALPQWLAQAKDVDAGVFKRIVLADIAAITVTGSLSLSNSDDSIAASVHLLLGLDVFFVAMEISMLSLRIVGPTSLVAVKETDAESAGNKQVKRVAPGAIELVCGPKFYDPSADSVKGHSSLIWPLLLLNTSDPKDVVLQNMLLSLLGKGSFDLLRAKASVASFVQVEFEIEKDLTSEEFIFVTRVGDKN